MSEFGIWTLPATQGAVRVAAESGFEPAHYDAVERWVRRAGNREITRQDVENVRLARDSHEAAICQQCGLFHEPPPCFSYPPNWPKCPVCGAPALDGHITCGKAACAEGEQR